MAINTNFLIVVESKSVKQIWPQNFNGALNLTTIPIQAALSPELNKLDLNEYIGKAIVISGQPNGAWIWSAKVKEVAGPLVYEILSDMEKNV